MVSYLCVSETFISSYYMRTYIFEKKHLTGAVCGVLALLLTFISCDGVYNHDEKDYSQYVNCFIGTSENGHTFPGACRPFSLIQTSPVTGTIGWMYCSEYRSQDSIIWGFSQTHLNGTGCADLGDILVMPFTGEEKREWNGYRSFFRKETESASPGYYTVTLDKHKVKAELTSTERVAFHRYTFLKDDVARILIDLQHSPAWNNDLYHRQADSCQVDFVGNKEIHGYLENTSWVNQKIFFVIEFDSDIEKHTKLDRLPNEKGDRLIVSFKKEQEKEQVVMMKIALSTVSVEGAKKNLNSELPKWNFDEVKKQSREEWNKVLRKVDVEATDEEKTNFYTAMYHLFIQPNCISDVDGRYRNCKDSIVTANNNQFYSTFSLWDTYRAAHPMYTIIAQEKVNPFINSLIEQTEAQGFLPVWTLWGKDNLCMIGNHSVSVIAEAYNKGFNGFDVEKAFTLIKKGLNETEHGKNKWQILNQYGYYPTDLVRSESVSITLENCYDDYAAAVMAKRLNKENDYNFFINRASNYKNLFDKSTNFMRPKLSNGEWKPGFNPNQLAHAESVGGDYTEGNAWQYTWHVQHDVNGLINLFGDKETFTTKLDSLFTVQLEGEKLADVTGLIGQYAHGNEPSHHIAYLFALADKPYRTQELVREIFRTKYLNKSDGLCGNDDCGQMSAWYMFAAMGFYPLDPVSGEYIIGAPQLPKLSINLPNDKIFTIIAEGLSDNKMYVEKIYLNGKEHKSKHIDHKDIISGGELRFVMTDKK